MKRNEIKDLFLKYPILLRITALINILLMPILILIVAAKLTFHDVIPDAIKELKVLIKCVRFGVPPC